MNIDLISEIKSKVGSEIDYPPVKIDNIKAEEDILGFGIPALLKELYMEVANGGFGPAYGLVGMEGGYESDFGTLAELQNETKEYYESEVGKWPQGRLLFNEWGDNIYSCVDCTTNELPVYWMEGTDFMETGLSLESFYRSWVNGVDIFKGKGSSSSVGDIKNPFA